MKKNKKCNWKKTDTYISVSRNIEKEKKSHVELIKKNNVDTVYKVWQNSVKTYGDKKCLGTRQVFGEEDEQQKSGKVFKKLILSAIAAFSQNMIVTTLYTNLGEEAICHGILETEVSDDN